MGALGDYIHLKTENYLKYGTTKKDQFDAISSYQNFKKKRSSAIKELSNETIALLKQRLSKDNTIQNNKDKQESEKIFQKMVDLIYEKLAEQSTAAVLGWYQGNAKVGGGWAYSGDYQNLKKKALTKEKLLQKKSLVERINKLLDKIQIDGIKGQASQADIKEVSTLYKRLAGKKSALGEIQEDIDNFTYYTWISNLSGAFGEMFVAACGDAIDNNVNNTINEILSRIVGQKTSVISFDKNLIAKNLSNYIHMDETGTKYILGSSPDKVDVSMELNKEDVLASVKNYANPSRVALQGQVSLFPALIKLSEEGNYGNHWLNCHAGRIIKNETSNIANNVLQFEVAYEALVGGNPLKEGASQANVFVVMNRTTGDVIVKSTKEILFKELENIKITPSILNIRLKNTFNKTYQDRIVHILMQLHQKNLQVSYKTGL